MRALPQFKQVISAPEKVVRIYWPGPDGGQVYFPTGAPFWDKGNYLEVFYRSVAGAVLEYGS